MPSSNLALAPTLLAYVAEVINAAERPIDVLDVGPGYGKYGVLVREYTDETRIRRLDAVEAEARYLDRFPWLPAIYTRVIRADVTALRYEELAGYDLVLMLDVIEHLDKAAALELLTHIPGTVIVLTPRYYFQNPEAGQGWPTENHRSHWTPADFEPRADRFDVNAYDHLGAVLVRLAPL